MLLIDKSKSILPIFAICGLFVFSGCGEIVGTSSELSGGVVTLAWNAPSKNADGTTLTDLAGYKVFYGESSGSYSDSIWVGNNVTAPIGGLEYNRALYFAVAALDASGNRSDLSSEVSTIIPEI